MVYVAGYLDDNDSISKHSLILMSEVTSSHKSLNLLRIVGIGQWLLLDIDLFIKLYNASKGEEFGEKTPIN